MRTKSVAAVFVTMLAAPLVRADEWLPDWMLPAPTQEQGLQPARSLFADFGALSVDRPPALFPPGSAGIAADPAPGRVNLSTQTSFDLAMWQAKLEAPDYRELREVPGLSRDWKAEHSVNVPVPAEQSLFMFGQLNGSGDVDQTSSHVKTRTGLGMRFSPFAGSEVQVRTGSLITYEDSPLSRPQERSQLSVELQAKVALAGPLKLEYATEALPALAPTDRNVLLHDVKIALPLGVNREVSVGAKYRWDDSQTPTPWLQRAEMYIGLKFER